MKLIALYNCGFVFARRRRAHAAVARKCDDFMQFVVCSPDA